MSSEPQPAQRPAPAPTAAPAPAQTVHGRAPTNAAGVVQGPYGHVTTNPGGFNGGAGLLNGPLSPDGKVTGNALSANAQAGRWYGPNGQANYGANADASLVRVGMAPGSALGPVGFDAGVLSAQAGATANRSTAGIGAQANIIDGSVTVGGDHNSLRGGLSLGVGLAGRVHYGDVDGNGTRELGVGADFGPFSFDVKSEYLGRAWNGVSSAYDRVTSW